MLPRSEERANVDLNDSSFLQISKIQPSEGNRYSRERREIFISFRIRLEAYVKAVRESR